MDFTHSVAAVIIENKCAFSNNIAIHVSHGKISRYCIGDFEIAEELFHRPAVIGRYACAAGAADCKDENHGMANGQIEKVLPASAVVKQNN